MIPAADALRLVLNQIRAPIKISLTIDEGMLPAKPKLLYQNSHPGVIVVTFLPLQLKQSDISDESRGDPMLADQPAKWYLSSTYAAITACDHCNGIVRHEHWCEIVNHRVRYAYEIVHDAAQLTVQDQLILHALGISWVASTSICSTRSA